MSEPKNKNDSQQLSPPPAWVNRMMAWVLKSPLHRVVSKDIMLITLTGRKSGKKYTLPVSYVREEGGVLCSTNRIGQTWWKNLRGGADVILRLQGKDVSGHATAIYDDTEAIGKGIMTLLKHVPRDAKYYNVRLDAQKQPIAEDIAPSAKKRIIINIKI